MQEASSKQLFVRLVEISFDPDKHRLRPHKAALNSFQLWQKKHRKPTGELLKHVVKLSAFRPIHCISFGTNSYEFFAGFPCASLLIEPPIEGQHVTLFVWSAGRKSAVDEDFILSMAQAELAEAIHFSPDPKTMSADLFRLYQGLSSNARRTFFGTARKGAPTFSSLMGWPLKRVQKPVKKSPASVLDILGGDD